jgi:hypothetical protein
MNSSAFDLSSSLAGPNVDALMGGGGGGGKGQKVFTAESDNPIKEIQTQFGTDPTKPATAPVQTSVAQAWDNVSSLVGASGDSDNDDDDDGDDMVSGGQDEDPEIAASKSLKRMKKREKQEDDLIDQYSIATTGRKLHSLDMGSADNVRDFSEEGQRRAKLHLGAKGFERLMSGIKRNQLEDKHLEQMIAGDMDDSDDSDTDGDDELMYE